MALYSRKQYSGASHNTTTTTLLTNAGTTVDIAANTGWPSAAGVPFYVVIRPATNFEEKCLVTISGLTLTLTRAQDDTTASEHPIGSTIYPVFTANDADEANELVSKLTTKGDLLTTDGSSLNRLGVGSDGTVLVADSSATNGLTWGSASEIDAAFVIVNANNAATGNFIAGLEVERGASANVRLRWNEQTDKWQFTNDGSTYTDIGSITVSDTAPTGSNQGDLWYNSIELEVFIYYSSVWIQLTDSSEGIQELYELVDVLVEDSVSGDVLVYNGTEWVNGIAPTAQKVIEVSTISATAATGTVNFDFKTNSSLLYTSNAIATWVLNIRGNASTLFSSMISVGETVKISFLVTQGAGGASFYPTGLSIDGTSYTPKWQNGSAPTSGNANSVDIYSYSILKTSSSPSYMVFASQTRFA